MMDGLNSARWAGLLAIMLASFLATSVPASAQDDEIQRQLIKLADEDFEVRKAALDSLPQTRDRRLAGFLEAYQRGNIYQWRGKLVLCENFDVGLTGEKSAALSNPLTSEPLLSGQDPLVVPVGELTSVSPSRRDRRLVNNAMRVLALFSDDLAMRSTAARKAGDSGGIDSLPYLEEMLESESVETVRRVAQESLLLIRLKSDVADLADAGRLDAARELGEMRSARGAAALADLLNRIGKQTAQDKQIDPITRSVYEEAAQKIASYQTKVRFFGYFFSGLSLASVLILMALGLSIIFGQMGVINMAHGELMMIGAYATYEMQRLFGHSPDVPANWYFVAAAPVAFLSAALVGYLIEWLVVRHLYGRPLETLLATWGVSLVLIQAVRVRYGDNIGVNSPTWLVGSFEVTQDVVLPYNRCFIIILCGFCVLLIYGLLNRTRLGLLIRATVQNREMADALGVNTRRIDGYSFAFGSGLAGLAGYALTLIGGVTPNMGQNYIVDSFLVVVTGGVGKLMGTVFSGLGIGTLNKLLEPTFEAVWSKVLILLCVMLFIQWRPTGLFAQKGRLADV
jgi:urea transport system permease protein